MPERERGILIFSGAAAGFGFTEKGAKLLLSILIGSSDIPSYIDALLLCFFQEIDGTFYVNQYVASIMRGRLVSTGVESPAGLPPEIDYRKYGEKLCKLLPHLKEHPELDILLIPADTVRDIFRRLSHIYRSTEEYLPTDFFDFRQNHLTSDHIHDLHQSIAKRLGLSSRNILPIVQLNNQNTFDTTLPNTIKGISRKNMKLLLYRDDQHSDIYLMARWGDTTILFNTIDGRGVGSKLISNIINGRKKTNDEAATKIIVNNENRHDCTRHPTKFSGLYDFVHLHNFPWLFSEIVQNSVKEPDGQYYTSHAFLSKKGLRGHNRNYINWVDDFVSNNQGPLGILSRLSVFKLMDKVLSYEISVLVAEYADIVIEYAHIASRDIFGYFDNLLRGAFLFKAHNADEMIIPAGYVDVPRDGHCFYHAVGRQLGIDAPVLHQMAFAEVMEHPDRYASFELDFNQFVNAQMDDRVWAEHIMIQALVNALGRPLEIELFTLYGTHAQGNVMITPYEEPPLLMGDVDGRSPLRVANIGMVHFVTPESDTL